MSWKLLSPLLLLLSVGASAEIYRCEIEGVTVFSDTPCQPGHQPYLPKGAISVVSSPADLERTTELNQTFIRQRQEHQTREREARLARPPAALQPTPPPAAAPARLYLPPYYAPPRRHWPRPDKMPELEREERPFSALSGPFPGTRRDNRRP